MSWCKETSWFLVALMYRFQLILDFYCMLSVSVNRIYMPELNCSGPCMSKQPYYNLYDTKGVVNSYAS